MSTVTKPNTFSASTTISSSQVNANFDTIYNEFNGSISAANLATNAVTTAKITDSNVTTAKIADSAVTAAKVNFGGAGTGIWWEEIGRTTLGANGDTISVTSIPARTFLRVIVFALNSGQLDTSMRFNNDSGTNYSQQGSSDFGAGGDTVSASSIALVAGTPTAIEFMDMIIVNAATSEKLVMSSIVDSGGSGAANAPNSRRSLSKWSNTSVQINRIDINNAGTGDFAIGSEVVVLGHN